MCRLYGVPDERDGVHGAVVDALAACRLAWCIMVRGGVIRNVWDAKTRAERAQAVREWEAAKAGGLPDLHRAQQRWYAERAANYQEYVRKGDPKRGAAPEPDRVIPTDWPLVPYREQVVT